jgi:ABC-type transport system substrate-binding protein
LFTEETKGMTAGALLGLLAFILVFPAIPVQAQTSTSPLFSMTLLAPTTNPVRRQYSAIVANSFENAGISVNLVYVSFTVLISRLFPSSCPCTPLYNQGGFDLAFIGHGGGAPVPDFRILTGYHSEVGPPQNNYAVYKNTTVDSLIDQYQSTFDLTARNQLGQQIIRMVYQDEPYAVIYYPADIYGFKSYIQPWKQNKIYTTSELPDYEHWVIQQGNTVNLAVTGDLDSVNYLPSSASNTIYDLWMYGDVLSGLKYLNPLNLQFYNALATNVTHSADGKTWTITFRNNLWQDGVSVTADDFLFAVMASLNGAGNPVNLGTYQSILGLGTSFTFLNGTTRYTWNGTLYHSVSELPSGVNPSNFTTYKSLSPNSFMFTTAISYVFTDPILVAIAPLPMHILENIPESQWDTVFGNIADNTPKTVHWNAARYGGNGSYAYAYNDLIGNGPYLWHGYNPTTQTATLVANPLFWNATGLSQVGYYNVKTVHVVHIVDKSAALAAFSSGTVNVLDTNYQFNNDDKRTISNNGGYTTFSVAPGSGSQELGFNMNGPIWGTGTGTPNGQKDPANAERYARYVRHALSMLIPRQLIIQNLLQGNAAPGITEMPPAFGFLYPPDVTPEPYDPSGALKLLAAAGYSTSVASSWTPIVLPPVQPVQISGVSVTVPQVIVGQTLTFQGTFAVNTAAGAAGNGFAVVLEQTTDNKTWVPVLLAQTNSGGGFYIPYTVSAPGTYGFRVFLTGIPWTYVINNGISDPGKLEQLYQLTSSRRQFLNTTSPAYTPVSYYKVGTLSDVVSALSTAITTGLQQLSSGLTSNLNTVQNNLATQINKLGSNLTTLSNQVSTIQANSASKSDLNNLSSQVSTLTTVAYAALAVAIVLGLLAIALSRRRHS